MLPGHHNPQRSWHSRKWEDDRSLGATGRRISSTKISAARSMLSSCFLPIPTSRLCLPVPHAARLDITNTDVTISVDQSTSAVRSVPRAAQDAPPSYKKNLTIQTLSFKIHYDETTSTMLIAYVRNLVTSY